MNNCNYYTITIKVLARAQYHARILKTKWMIWHHILEFKKSGEERKTSQRSNKKFIESLSVENTHSARPYGSCPCYFSQIILFPIIFPLPYHVFWSYDLSFIWTWQTLLNFRSSDHPVSSATNLPFTLHDQFFLIL